MVDVVITYVDSKDKTWVESYQKFVKTPIENVENRFRSYDCLDLQIKLIRKNMKFTNNIFVVVSSISQVPENVKDLDNVYIITHEEIIPKRYLPCFNSCTIEMYLYNIKRLSEKFIYFNDDIFPINKCEETDFFIDDKIVINYEEKIYDLETASPFELNIINSTRLIDKTATTFIKPTHSCFPAIKSHIVEIISKNISIVQNSLTRTRHRNNINFYAFVDYEIICKNFIKKDNSFSYFTTFDNLKDIYDCIKESKTKFICVNDNDTYEFNDWKLQFRNILEYSLDKRKTIKFDENTKEILDNTPCKVALCAIAKNENLYIREWVEWYKNLGISKIFLYDNNEIDGERFEEVINDYIENKFVEVIDVRGVEKGCVYDEEGINLQPKCYIDCYENKVSDFDWVCFFDIDEFLSFKNGYNLFGFLNQEIFKDTATILIPWLMFTDNDLLYYESKPVLDRFTTPIYNIKVGVKSIVKTNLLFDSFYKTHDCLIHEFLPYKDCICKLNNGVLVHFDNSKHNLWKSKIVTKNDICVLNHYKTKSTEEYLNRHLGRHWGTSLIRSKNEKTLNECKKEYFRINKFTQDKENFFNNFTSKNRIVITLTTYPKRDMYIYDVLSNFIKNQTIKPDKIYLFLAEEEYDKENLPYSIKKSIDENLCEIKWTYNSYCHKRHEVFKFEYNSYVMTIDDDMYYPNTYIEELYNYSRTNNNTICQYVGFYDNYEGTKRITNSNKITVSNLSGATICFPPKSFPIECLNYNEIRDKICPTCDESWIQSFLLKENKLIKFLHHWNYRKRFFKPIENSQESAMHKTMSKKNDNDIRFREQCFCNVIKFLEIETLISKIWPKLDINKCSSIIVLKNDKYKILIDKLSGNVINTNYLEKCVYEFYPNYVKLFGLNLKNPVTYQEKIHWMKIHDVTNLKAKCADKILVHEYCKEKLGKDICIPIIKVYDSPKDININDLPEKFVLKCNHGYKMNIICTNKNSFNINNAIKKCETWLNDDFGLRTLQLHYSLIDRKCFIEQYMNDGHEDLIDYKFLCFNGEPKYCEIISDRHNNLKRLNYYDMNFNFMNDFDRSDFHSNDKLLDKKPANFELMKKYARILSKDFKYVRVDFYEINNTVYLGELTFTPANGNIIYKNENTGKIIGDLLDLNS